MLSRHKSPFVRVAFFALVVSDLFDIGQSNFISDHLYNTIFM